MFKQLLNGKLIVGIDVDDQYFQISYCHSNSENIETVSTVAGAEIYNIPTVLCKRPGVNQWFYGKEALNYASENDAPLIDNLLTLALDGEPVRIEDEDFDPSALMALFFKRSMGLLSQVGSLNRIDILVITTENLDYHFIDVMTQVVANLRLSIDQVHYQNHTESFYYFMLYQSQELWMTKSLLVDYKLDNLHTYLMECNRRTKPVVALISEEKIPFMAYDPMPEDENLKQEKLRRLDSAFSEEVRHLVQSGAVASVYLIGDAFSEEWMQDSLKLLCSGRRVFTGNNLFSKGACYGMLEKLEISETGKEHVFLGNDKLKANIGMNVLRKGEPSYYALLDAGENWFEAHKTIEVYIQEGNVLEFMISSLVGRGNVVAKITLDELESEVTRLQVHLYLQAEDILVVEITDLGLGELLGDYDPDECKMWRHEITL